MREVFEAGVALTLDALPTPIQITSFSDQLLTDLAVYMSKALKNLTEQLSEHTNYQAMLLAALVDHPDVRLREAADFWTDSMEYGNQIADAHYTVINQLLAEMSVRGIDYKEPA